MKMRYEIDLELEAKNKNRLRRLQQYQEKRLSTIMIRLLMLESLRR